MFAVSSRCKNDSQLCFKCLHCLDSQITVLLQWYLSVCVLVHANNDFLCSCFSTTLNTYFIWPFSVTIWIKHSKCALNIDSNGHQKTKNKRHEKRFKTTKNSAQKHVFTSIRLLCSCPDKYLMTIRLKDHNVRAMMIMISESDTF